MLWNLSAIFVVAVIFNAHLLKAKLALEHSPKSSEMLSNAIYSSKNNEITEVELNDDKDRQKVENEIEEIQEEKPTSLFLGKHEMKVKSFNNENQQKKVEYKIEKTQSNKSINETLKAVTTKSKIPTSKPTKLTTLKTSKVTGNTKSQLSSNFINPFGQLSAFFGSDQLQYLQDYNFLFNAERHTIFQLHTIVSPTISNSLTTTTKTATATTTPLTTSRVLNAVVGSSLSAAFGVNPTATNAGVTTTTATTRTTKVEEVQLYNAASLRQSRFNPFNPTRILIHGWFGGSRAGVYNTLIPEYLKLANGSYNVFTVDWGRGAVADYITASYRVKPVGKVVAKFIDFLHREAGMSFDELHVIGFSMGAHIAGIAGKHIETGRLPIIYALDPALPLFRYENIDERIALTDADYVEVIHTSVGSYGYDRPLGHVDFYVNYGSGQPGCFFNECSHFRAFQIFAESIHSPDAFRGQGCDVKLWLDLIKNRRCLMGTGRNLTMGGDPSDAVAVRKRGGGVYYFTTNANSPYAKI